MAQREHLLKVGVSGVRGVVGPFLTPQLACEFGQAFGTYVGPGKVVVGRDTRATGPMLQHAVQCGLLAAGCSIVDVGVLPTPTIQVYIGATRARGGIALTASHNPPEYNALKLFNHEGLFFNTYERNDLLDLYHQSAFHEASNQQMGRIEHEAHEPKRIHLERVLHHVDVPLIRSCRYRVALDAVNGAGAVMTPGFLQEELGCELHAISIDPTQPFPRVAEPRPDTLGDLSALVKQTGSDIGFAHDPDGDRLAMADEHGRVLDNDDVLALVTQAVLERVPGDIVVNLTTSSVMEDLARVAGRTVYRTAVGEANVVEAMQAHATAIGGEGSNGGIIFPAVHLCRDSYTGMAFVLNRMAATGKSVSELVSALPYYARRLGKVPFEHGRLAQAMRNLQRQFPDAQTDLTDGLKLIWNDAWLHVRASNTEPLLRIAVEARSQERMEQLYGLAVTMLS